MDLNVSIVVAYLVRHKIIRSWKLEPAMCCYVISWDPELPMW